MKLSSSLSWADKLVLVQKYNLTTAEACTAFGVTDRELNVAKNLQTRGIFAPTDLNTEIYSDFFGKLRSGEIDNTATKTFKPKGVRPSKITQAFESITNMPQPVSSVVDTFGVSLAVLRQSKRFDKANSGQVHIRKDKETGILMVWRESC